MTPLGWVCVIVGILGFVAAFRLADRNRGFDIRSVPATATVLPYETRLEVNTDNYPISIYHLVLQMELDGRRRFATVADVGTNWQPFPVGAVLRVRYDPMNPEDFRLDIGSRPDVRARAVALFSITCLLIALMFGQPSREGDEIISTPGDDRTR